MTGAIGCTSTNICLSGAILVLATVYVILVCAIISQKLWRFGKVKKRMKIVMNSLFRVILLGLFWCYFLKRILHYID